MDCYFCKKNIKDIDFKDIELLNRFISGLGKIKAKKRSNACSKHQRQLAQSVKRARHLGLLSAVTK